MDQNEPFCLFHPSNWNKRAWNIKLQLSSTEAALEMPSPVLRNVLLHFLTTFQLKSKSIFDKQRQDNEARSHTATVARSIWEELELPSTTMRLLRVKISVGFKASALFSEAGAPRVWRGSTFITAATSGSSALHMVQFSDSSVSLWVEQPARWRLLSAAWWMEPGYRLHQQTITIMKQRDYVLVSFTQFMTWILITGDVWFTGGRWGRTDWERSGFYGRHSQNKLN